MQSLSHARNGADGAAVDPCARAILDGLPQVMWFIRRHMRSHRTAGMTVPQFRALAIIDSLPDPSLSEIAEYLGATEPTTSRVVSGLVNRGYVTRKTCSDDRRQCALALTARGRAILATARRATLQGLSGELEHLDPAQRQTVIAAMRVLRDTFAPASVTSMASNGND